MAVVAIPIVLSLVEHVACFGELYMYRIDADIAQGRYVSSGNAGISFNSSSTSLSIFDLLGNEVLLVEETSCNQQWIRIHGNSFLQLYVSDSKGYRDYYIPKFLYDTAKFESKQLNITVLEVLDTLSSHYHYNNLQRSIKALLENPSFDAMKRAVFTLGATLQRDGDTYPSLLPLYLVVNMLEKFQVAEFTGMHKFPSSEKDNTIRNEECFEECPPCPDEDCLSLCGYGCHCWKWVCGDCCYHLGCHGHDVCCRENFIQTKCLFPISFKCESEYSC